MITYPSNGAPLAALLQQVREEYGKMPGLQLTKPQAMRLFGVAPSVCAAMLRALNKIIAIKAKTTLFTSFPVILLFLFGSPWKKSFLGIPLMLNLQWQPDFTRYFGKNQSIFHPHEFYALQLNLMH